jgi:hypothetical protein
MIAVATSVLGTESIGPLPLPATSPSQLVPCAELMGHLEALEEVDSRLVAAVKMGSSAEIAATGSQYTAIASMLKADANALRMAGSPSWISVESLAIRIENLAYAVTQPGSLFDQERAVTAALQARRMAYSQLVDSRLCSVDRTRVGETPVIQP